MNRVGREMGLRQGGSKDVGKERSYHLLPVVKPNLKPEGKGSRGMQPKVWEDRRLIWRNEWRLSSTPLLASGDPGVLTGPGKNMEGEPG